ncbi:hypothetical protein KM031_20305 (plasmid) [Gemmobacter fulvus]|uniref:Alpha/beta hydrolase n=1 Tax=Gemmobacter fulvus TaxID=2840474 RepID=A0A975S3Z5_9RHOB|nr:hypothetical protein [Gemmobacter fulvus]MBT9248043.1 hypothetical protein [Gemmobacter fulvus]QWK92931.1 hypothetical protein KM031_20305 [Gemmobacter fulvus]
MLAGKLNAETMIVDGAGHYPHTEMPELVAPRILSFLEGLRAASKLPEAPVIKVHSHEHRHRQHHPDRLYTAIGLGGAVRLSDLWGWNNFSQFDGVAQVGTRLELKMAGKFFGSTVSAASQQARLEWAATLFRSGQFCSRHISVLTANPDVTTHLDNVETFLGALVWPFKGQFKQGKKGRDKGYDGFKAALKASVECRFAAAFRV